MLCTSTGVPSFANENVLMSWNVQVDLFLVHFADGHLEDKLEECPACGENRLIVFAPCILYFMCWSGSAVSGRSTPLYFFFLLFRVASEVSRQSPTTQTQEVMTAMVMTLRTLREAAPDQ